MLRSDARILVIDDKPFSRATTVRLLRGMGVRKIVEAMDGADGLEAYATLWPHVVICEPEMKPVDGIVFLQTLVAEKKHLVRIAPVIFLSTESNETQVAQARQLGAAAYLRKPISMAALCRKIDGAIGLAGDIYGESTPAPPAVARSPFQANVLAL
jgi:two-component system chemotaxis response regulator CheY